jgi:hypothetical protein
MVVLSAKGGMIMFELFDLHTARGFLLFVSFVVMAILGVMLIHGLISLVIINRRLRKMAQALEELGTMPLDEWEAKWADYIHKGYIECDDPHKDDVEQDMKFFKEIRDELNKED